MGRPRPCEPLLHLHRKIDQALVHAGLAPERRAFVPHVTLARFGRGMVGPERLPPPFPSLAFRVSAFGLYESRLGHEGASYELAVHYPLAQTPAASSSCDTSGR